MVERDDVEGDLLLREVDEELRQDQLLAFWKRYGTYAVGIAVALVLGVAGHQYWRAHQRDLSQTEASRFAELLDLEAQGKNAEAAQGFASFLSNSKTGYATLGKLRRAEELGATGDKAAAVQAYEDIAADKAVDGIYRDLAILKLSWLTVDTGNVDELERRVSHLAADGQPWRHSAREILALVAQRKGQIGHMREIYQQLADDASAPRSLRGRAAELLAALSGKDKG